MFNPPPSVLADLRRYYADLASRYRSVSDAADERYRRWREAANAAQRLYCESYLDDDVLNRCPYTTVSCSSLRELFYVFGFIPRPKPYIGEGI